MPKRIQKVQDVIIKAKKKGSAKSGPYEAIAKGNDVRLYHYDTLIFEFVNGSVTRLGGYSESDKNAISSAMEICGVKASVSKSKKYINKGYPVMDGWYIIRWG